jgi:hypothetical protein
MFFRAVVSKSSAAKVASFMRSAGRKDAEGNFVLLGTKYFGLVSPPFDCLLRGAQITVSTLIINSSYILTISAYSSH